MQADEKFMRKALEEARKAYDSNEVPVGAIVVAEGRILASAHNSPIANNDPSAHAEMLALRKAARKTGNYRLVDAMLYVTLEPCIMCAGAIIQARFCRVVFGARDPKNGGVVSLYRILGDQRMNHRVEVTEGVLKEECGEILSRFFRQKRVTSAPASVKQSLRTFCKK